MGDREIIEQARQEAVAVVAADPELAATPTCAAPWTACWTPTASATWTRADGGRRGMTEADRA
jgi:hypothetical protein